MFPVIGAQAISGLVQVNEDGTSPGWAAELGFTQGPGAHKALKRGVPPTHKAVADWIAAIGKDDRNS